MQSRTGEVKDFNICIGGMFSKPSSGDPHNWELWSSYATRSGFRSMLKSEENVERVFDVQEDKADEWGRLDGALCMDLEDGEEIETNCWRIPVVFKLNVKKGFKYEDSEGMVDVIQSPLKAAVVYNGVWFVAAYEPNQSSDLGEAFWLEPRIR